MDHPTSSKIRILLAIGLGLAFVLLFPHVLPDYLVILTTQSLIYAIAAMSLDILL